MYDIIVFENLCFRPSIRKRVEAVVFKNLHSGDRFWKAASFIPVNAVYTWTKGKKRKNLRFQKFSDSCGRALKSVSVICLNTLSSFPLIWAGLIIYNSSLPCNARCRCNRRVQSGIIKVFIIQQCIFLYPRVLILTFGVPRIII